MKTRLIIIFFSVLLIVSCQDNLDYNEIGDSVSVELRSSVNGIEKYNYPSDAPTGAKFSVKIGGVDHYVYPVVPTAVRADACSSNETVIPEIVSFGIQDNYTTTLVIKLSGKSLNSSNCKVRPKNRLVTGATPPNLHYSVKYNSDGSLALTITGPQMLCFEIGGDLLRPLLVFANKLETYFPNASNWSGKIYEYKAGTSTFIDDTIKLKSNDMVYIAPGAIVKGMFRTENNATNVQIRGRGIITGIPNKDRSIISMNGVNNAYIEGITVVNSLNWVIALYGCNNSAIERVRVVSQTGWDDGIDLVGCRDTRVFESFVMSKDDGIVIKAGCRYGPFDKDEIQLHGDQDVYNIDIRNCIVWNGRSGSALEIGENLNTASVKKITYDYIQIFHALNCSSNEDKGGYQAAISINNTGEAIVEDVTYRNIYVEHVEQQFLNLFVRESKFYSPSEDSKDHGLSNIYTNRKYIMGAIKNVKFENVFVDRADALSSSIQGLGPLDGKTNLNKISGINIKNLFINGQKVSTYTLIEGDNKKNDRIYIMNENFNPADNSYLKIE